MTTALYAALLTFLYIGLTVQVIRARVEHKVSLGDGGKLQVQQAIRAHGNFSEYTPLFLVLLGLAEYQDLPLYGLHALGGVFLISRVLHAYGVGIAPNPNTRRMKDRKSRALGMTGTLLVLLASAAIVLVQYITALSF